MPVVKAKRGFLMNFNIKQKRMKHYFLDTAVAAGIIFEGTNDQLDQDIKNKFLALSS